MQHYGAAAYQTTTKTVESPRDREAALLIKADTKSIETAQLATGDSKKCPQCAEIVKAEARVCRFCNHTFLPGQGAY